MQNNAGLAKIRHTQTLKNYLSDPSNPRIPRVGYARLVGISTPENIYRVFSPEELRIIEEESLAECRRRYAPQLKEIDKALLEKAASGSHEAARLAYQRFEQWSEKKILDITGNFSFTALAQIVNETLPLDTVDIIEGEFTNLDEFSDG